MEELQLRKLFCMWLIFQVNLVHAETPWLTGPFLAIAGSVTPLGVANLQILAFAVNNVGSYDENGKNIPIQPVQNDLLTPQFTVGLTDKIDIQYILPYNYNHTFNHSNQHIGDGSVMLGYQALSQDNNSLTPDLRITIQEVFPTGRYSKLNPEVNGSDSTGLGSYQTQLSFNFQYLYKFYKEHYLNAQLNLSGQVASHTTLAGVNVYGGDINTLGNISPGSIFSTDFAGEFTLTQNWVLVMEGYLVFRQASRFKNAALAEREDSLAVLGTGSTSMISFAPAVEYNFSEQYGIIAGSWFTVAGRNTTAFNSFAIAFNAIW